MSIKTTLLLASTIGLMTLLPSEQSMAKEDNSATAKQEAKKEHKSYRASKKVPAMRNRVYTQFARAQKLADDGDQAAGLLVLAEVEERLDSLNGYEQAMLYNFFSFMHYANDDIDNAL